MTLGEFQVLVNQSAVVAYIFNPSMLEAEVWSQFQESQDYEEKPCLKKGRKKKGTKDIVEASGQTVWMLKRFEGKFGKLGVPPGGKRERVAK